LVSSAISIAALPIVLMLLLFVFQFLRSIQPLKSAITWIFRLERAFVHGGSFLIGALIPRPWVRRLVMFVIFSSVAVGGAISDWPWCLGILFFGFLCVYFVFRHWWKIEDDVEYYIGSQPIRRNLNVEMVAACACLLIFAPVALAQIREANLGINFDGNAFEFIGFTIVETFRNGVILQLPFVPHITAPKLTGVAGVTLSIFRVSTDVIILASIKRLLDIAKRAGLGLDMQPQIEQLETGNVQKCQQAIERLVAFALNERPYAKEILEDILTQSGRAIINPDVLFDANVRFSAADAFLSIGETRKNTRDLLIAINGFRTIVGEDWTDRYSIGWGRVHEKLGDCYTSYGRLETYLDRMRSAVRAYREAGRAYQFLEMPDERARARVKFGDALHTLGERENNNVQRFINAVAAFRDALTVYDPERTPDQWRRAQTSLGNTLTMLSDRPPRGSTASDWLNQAAEAFDAASQADKDNDSSAERLEVQLLLAKTLRRSAELDPQVGLSTLERCAEIYGRVLKFYPRRNDPDTWATIQQSFGGVLVTLAEREVQPKKRLEQAIDAYRSVLEEWTREKSPTDWAKTMKDLGLTQMKLGFLEDNIELLKSAISSFDCALVVYASDTKLAERMTIQTHLGNAWVMIGDCHLKAEEPIDAAKAFREAQTVLERVATKDELELVRQKLKSAETRIQRLRQLNNRSLLVRLWGHLLPRRHKATERKEVAEQLKSEPAQSASIDVHDAQSADAPAD
jgi:tetratricopeptide (TPR) repeat protein